MCELSSFVKGQKKIVAETDWDWGCRDDWEIPEGTVWETITGDPPSKEYFHSTRWTPS
jgi:hypothetical protein